MGLQTTNTLITSLKVISITGQVVAEKAEVTGNSLTLDVFGLPNGTYIIKVADGNSVSNSKFIKQ
jgi:hypothetical protein